MTAVDERRRTTARQGGARSARGQRTVRPTTSVPATTEAAPPAAPVEPPPVSVPAAPAAPPRVEAVEPAPLESVARQVARTRRGAGTSATARARATSRTAATRARTTSAPVRPVAVVDAPPAPVEFEPPVETAVAVVLPVAIEVPVEVPIAVELPLEPELAVEPEPAVEPELPVEPEPEPEPALVLQPPSAAAFAAYAAAVAEGLFADAIGPEDEPEDEPEYEPEYEPDYVPAEVADAQPVPVVRTDEPPAPVVEAAPVPHLVPVPYPSAEGPTEWSEQPAAPMPSLVGYGRIVTVYSPKGGAGTTFFATNLAVALADGGRRRVCLVDLDLQFGDIAIATSVTPSRGIVDAVDLDLVEDPTALSRILTPVLDGLDSLLAPVDPAAGDAVTPQLVSDLLTTLRGRYDYVVVDTSTYLSEITLEALDAADHQVLLTTPDLPSIKNMRLFLDTLDLLGADPARRAVVLNRLDQRVGLQAGRATEALRHPLAAVVPADPEVGASIDAGRPLLVVRRADTMNAVLRTFAEHHLGAAPQAVTGPKRRLRRGRKNAS